MSIDINKRIKQTIWLLIRKLGFGHWILRYYPNSYLKNVGWFTSFFEWRPVDKNRNPLPWLNYAFLHFIETRLNKEMRIFEYGCGNSTLWFADRVKEVVSVENNDSWVEEISSKLPTNGKIIYSTNMEDYTKKIAEYGIFDVVLIDGEFREECWKVAINSLTDDGIIIWDNSNLARFSESIESLRSLGFRQIFFHGLAPGNFTEEQTSIFYRNNNCIGI